METGGTRRGDPKTTILHHLYYHTLRLRSRISPDTEGGTSEKPMHTTPFYGTTFLRVRRDTSSGAPLFDSGGLVSDLPRSNLRLRSWCLRTTIELTLEGLGPSTSFESGFKDWGPSTLYCSRITNFRNKTPIKQYVVIY